MGWRDEWGLDGLEGLDGLDGLEGLALEGATARAGA